MSNFVLQMKDNKTESVTFRTSKELKEALMKMAEKENRTLSNMIEMLLEQAVKNASKKKQ